jgi:TniQ
MRVLRGSCVLKPLPIVLKAVPDELLSSWLRRHARFYGVTEAGLIDWLGLGVLALRTLDHQLGLGQVARLSQALYCDPKTLVEMTHTPLPAEARPLVRQGRAVLVCRSCAARHRAGDAEGAVLKSWIEAWRITCRLCARPLSETGSLRGNADTLRKTSIFGEQWWHLALEGEGIVECHIRGSVTPLSSQLALMRLLLLPSWYRPEQPFAGFYSGWLLNELVPGFDARARLIKRRVNQGAIGSIPPDLRVALLAGIALVAADPTAVIDHLRPACRLFYQRRFEELAAAVSNQITPSQIDSKCENMRRPLSHD